MVKPRSYSYSNIDKHGDDQILIFTENNDRLHISIICDGVSSCSCGHVAAAYICFFIKEYFKKYFTDNTDQKDIKKFADEAIKFAAQKLIDFTFILLNQKTLKDTEPVNNKKETAANSPKEGVQKTVSPWWLTVRESENNKNIPFILYETNEATPEDDSWKEYKTICTELNYPLFSANKEKILKLLDEGQKLSFECTLSLNLLYETSPATWEILSINYGDSEFYVITWDKKENNITAFLPHYRISQDGLRNYICSVGNGIAGDPVILTRNININDTIILTTDGAYLHYTTKGGFPYEPFKKRFNDCGSAFQKLEELPKAWFDYLNSNQAVNDDYSMVLIFLFENTVSGERHNIIRKNSPKDKPV